MVLSSFYFFPQKCIKKTTYLTIFNNKRKCIISRWYNGPAGTLFAYRVLVQSWLRLLSVQHVLLVCTWVSLRSFQILTWISVQRWGFEGVRIWLPIPSLNSNANTYHYLESKDKPPLTLLLMHLYHVSIKSIASEAELCNPVYWPCLLTLSLFHCKASIKSNNILHLPIFAKASVAF